MKTLNGCGRNTILIVPVRQLRYAGAGDAFVVGSLLNSNEKIVRRSHDCYSVPCED